MKLNIKYITIFLFCMISSIIILRTYYYHKEAKIEVLIHKNKLKYSDDFLLKIDGKKAYCLNKECDSIIKKENKTTPNIAKSDIFKSENNQFEYLNILLEYMKLDIATESINEENSLLLKNDFFDITMSYEIEDDTVVIESILINHLTDELVAL